jgi:hypothetical protein
LFLRLLKFEILTYALLNPNYDSTQYFNYTFLSGFWLSWFSFIAAYFSFLQNKYGVAAADY